MESVFPEASLLFSGPKLGDFGAVLLSPRSTRKLPACSQHNQAAGKPRVAYPTIKHLLLRIMCTMNFQTFKTSSMNYHGFLFENLLECPAVPLVRN